MLQGFQQSESLTQNYKKAVLLLQQQGHLRTYAWIMTLFPLRGLCWAMW